MPKKRKTSRHRNSSPQHQQRSQRTLRAVPDAPPEPDLFASLAAALGANEPIDFLASVGMLMSALDPRGQDAFQPDELPITLTAMVESFIDISVPQTTAALHVIRELTTDEVLAAGIDRELKTRQHHLPLWLTSLGSATAAPHVWSMRHVLGDGDDYLVGVQLATGGTLSALVHLDHNLSAVVTDAFVTPDSPDVMADRLRAMMTPGEQVLEHTDPAMARALLEEGIKLGATVYPPIETDDWPAWRLVVEWMIRKLPAGAMVPEFKETTQAEMDAIADVFLASRFGRELDGPDDRDLLEKLVWYATGWSGSDPYRWSGVRVELLMLDWFPRKIIAPREFMARMPAVLRAYVRYSHDRRGIPAPLTREVLTAVDTFEGQYLEYAIGHPKDGRNMVVESLRQAGVFGDPDDLDDEDYDAWSDDYRRDEISAEEFLAEAVGGLEALEALDDVPLPDEEFNWADIPEHIVERVEEVRVLVDGCADTLFDVEHRTAMRRLLARAASGDPRVFTRKTSPARSAAAIAWAITSANDTAGPRSGGPLSKDLLAHFGVKGSVSDRAEILIRAAEMASTPYYWPVRVTDPGMLVGKRRAGIVQRRERLRR